MLDFQNLNVYQESKIFRKDVLQILKSSNRNVDKYLIDQLIRASLSVILNIAEGTGKYTKASRTNYYKIARGSIYECSAILELMYEDGLISEVVFTSLTGKAEGISKMLYFLIKNTRS